MMFHVFKTSCKMTIIILSYYIIVRYLVDLDGVVSFPTLHKAQCRRSLSRHGEGGGILWVAECHSKSAKLGVSISQEVKDRVARQNPDPSTGTRRAGVDSDDSDDSAAEHASTWLQHVKRDSFGRSMFDMFDTFEVLQKASPANRFGCGHTEAVAGLVFTGHLHIFAH